VPATFNRTAQAARRPRVLVVEDESMRPLKLEEKLDRDGYTIVGPYYSVVRALGGLPETEIDAAVLDVDVRDALIFPLVDELAEQGVPFVFLADPASRILLEQYQEQPALTKPFDAAALLHLLGEILPTRRAH
jgi:DNA-binding response OmpR family regulator